MFEAAVPGKTGIAAIDGRRRGGPGERGDLTITGDGSANGVIVFQLGEGQYRVVGTNHGGSATRIRRGNWIANSQTVSGVTDDVIIDMRGGGDRLNFSHTPAYGPNDREKS